MELRKAASCRPSPLLSLLRPPRCPLHPRAAPACPLAPVSPFSHHSPRRPLSARAHNERLRAHHAAHPTPTGQFTAPVLDSLFLAARAATYTVDAHDLNALHARIAHLTDSALQPEDGKLPEEQRVLSVLEQLDALAQSLIDGHTAESLQNINPTPTGQGQGPEHEGSTSTRTNTNTASSATRALLGSVHTRSYPAFITKASLLNLVSEKAEHILRHPDIFITPALLAAYVSLQTRLHRPQSLPDIFHLYAHKPVPTRASANDPVHYDPPRPSHISTAIPTPTATAALASAIAARSLPLTLSILHTTFCTPAYKKSKLLRHALLPASGLAIAPLAAYTLSTHFAAWQTTMTPAYATGVAFAGTLTYVAAVSSIGYVAITTANDHMDRVTWAQGVPLWERWVREEERAALDAVAGAWGFEDVARRGEEEGAEWEALREFVGERGMVLDKVELMEGME